MKPQISRRKEIIKIRAEINEIESKKAIEKISETKSFFFFLKAKQKLMNLSETNKGKKRRYSNKIRNERGEVTPDTTEVSVS